MGNYTKWTSERNTNEGDYVVVLFISRNKDNNNLFDFKERRKAYFRRNNPEAIMKEFDHFVQDGVCGELCRLYISVNPRNSESVRKALIHQLIDVEYPDFTNINAYIAGIAAKKEHALTSHWLFDFDLDDESMVMQFIDDIHKIDPMMVISYKKTVNGYAVIADHGFDTRKLMEAWGESVTLKRDDLILVKWAIKED